MTRGIAHDFRNVLCMLTSGVNIAEASADDPAKLRLALAAMREGVARGLKMTNRLLDFARQQELKPGAENINALLAALETFLSYGAGPGIRLVLELAPELPRCVVDPPQLNAAILNLIVNARDAMPDGGVIRISTAVAHPKRRGGAQDYVRVRVRDNGAGMPADVLAKVFDPFFTTKGAGGTGLGIPQVQAFMDKLGGYLTVHSTVGEGSAFDLFFPVEEKPQPAAPDAWRQIDRWADEGGAIAPPPIVHATP
ncbi:MAG TPA: ATP-binding protein [Sphingomicrobium sp.]|nr:ATP-binding protein [Sphingomicrobium sp.]